MHVVGACVRCSKLGEGKSWNLTDLVLVRVPIALAGFRRHSHRAGRQWERFQS